MAARAQPRVSNQGPCPTVPPAIWKGREVLWVLPPHSSRVLRLRSPCVGHQVEWICGDGGSGSRKEVVWQVN